MKSNRPIAFAISASALTMTAMPVLAQDLSMWARSSSAPLAERVIERWNAERPDAQIELTVIPPSEMVTKFVTAATMGDVPDLLSLDLIFAPPFMRAGFLENLTDFVAADPNWEKTVEAHRTLATYDGEQYGVPFAPENSILIYNKDLFRQAGLDPDDPPSNSAEVLDAARKIRALGDDIYGYYFSGACGGCNIFTTAPQMWATPGTVVLPGECGEEALVGESIPAILSHYRTMWEEGLMPEGVQVDSGTNFVSAFAAGNIGMAGLGNFAIGTYHDTAPDLDFGVAPLPGGADGEVGSFAGGDILVIPEAAVNKEGALEFMTWVLSDAVQQEVYAGSGNMPARLDIAEAAFAGDERLATTVEALKMAQTPYTTDFFALSNDPNGPWLATIQTAVFEGDIEGAIATGKERMNTVICD